MDEPLLEGIVSYNRGDYFAAGEWFEQAARLVDAELAPMVEAFNRLAAALHLRLERGGRQGPINLISQAMLTLEDLKPSRAGIDVERLCTEFAAFADELRATPRDSTGFKHKARLFVERRRAPKIHFIE